jgi:hypothetical protein
LTDSYNVQFASKRPTDGATDQPVKKAKTDAADEPVVEGATGDGCVEEAEVC